MREWEIVPSAYSGNRVSQGDGKGLGKGQLEVVTTLQNNELWCSGLIVEGLGGAQRFHILMLVPSAHFLRILRVYQISGNSSPRVPSQAADQSESDYWRKSRDKMKTSVSTVTNIKPRTRSGNS